MHPPLCHGLSAMHVASQFVYSATSQPHLSPGSEVDTPCLGSYLTPQWWLCGANFEAFMDGLCLGAMSPGMGLHVCMNKVSRYAGQGVSYCGRKKEWEVEGGREGGMREGEGVMDDG